MFVGEGSASAAVGWSSVANEVARLEQALIDLQHCEGAEVVLIRCDSAEDEQVLVQRLRARARQLSFVTASLPLGEHGLDALDELVRRLVASLEAPRSDEGTGLRALLDAYRAKHGAQGRAKLLRGAAAAGANGDLTALCLAQVGLARVDSARVDSARVDSAPVDSARVDSTPVDSTAGPSPTGVDLAWQAWLDGTELGRHVEGPIARSALNEKTARRALAELTRLVRSLGYAGCFVCLTGGEKIARRTPRQRERAYTVLRELIDNFDSGRGLSSARLVLTGGARLFEGPSSLCSLAALRSRLEVPTPLEPPPPHRSWVRLVPFGSNGGEERTLRRAGKVAVRRLVTPARHHQRAIRTLIRVAQGLPPTEAVASMSVGHELIDQLVKQLLEHARMDGSVFTVLQGEYGTGKTHFLLHLADRALAEGHPVFRLNLERLNIDLGNPARHLQRLLDESEMPLPRRPSALDLLASWTRSGRKLAALNQTLSRVAREPSDAAGAARKALRYCQTARDPARALETYLSGHDLRSKPASKGYRQDAYGRLLLWVEALRRLEGCQGPVLLIDEAENLYVSGASPATRRTALRSLSFYCGGALPSACVVLASTPKAFSHLKYEAGALLWTVSEQSTLCAWEDATMLRRRLLRLTPQEVPALTFDQREQLAERVLATHRGVRGGDHPRDLSSLVNQTDSPRVLLRRLVDRLEAEWWRVCPEAPVRRPEPLQDPPPGDRPAAE